MTSPGRPLPHSLEAEEYVLACIFLDGADILTRCLEANIGPESFYDPKHGTIYAAAMALMSSGKPTEVPIVAEYLKSTRELEAAGGYAFLGQVSSRAPTTAQASFFIEIVAEQHALRQLIRSATSAVEDAYGYAGGDVRNLVEKAGSSILSIGSKAAGAPNWRDSIKAAKARVMRQLNPETANEPDDAISFGFSDLDNRFGPMRPGQVVVIGARPSVGKSSLARQIAAHNATRAGKLVLFASLEVMGESLALNLAQTLSGVSVKALKPTIHPKEAAEYQRAMNAIETPNLDVIAASNVSIGSIRARCQLHRARGTPVKLIVVDYLQLLPDCVAQKGENRASSVGRASRALKALAINENCPVIVLSQLNRDSAKDNREPSLHDLRESGDIEQDGDKIILLHRPSENPATRRPQPETAPLEECPCFFTNAIQAKGRDDGTALVSLSFRRVITRFEQIIP